jgi:hypothetical protein
MIAGSGSASINSNEHACVHEEVGAREEAEAKTSVAKAEAEAEAKAKEKLDEFLMPCVLLDPK